MLTGLAIAGWLVAMAPPVTAQGSRPDAAPSEAPAAGTVEQELARLNQTLARILVLLEQNLEIQKTDILYRRLEILDTRLQSGRDSRRNARERDRELEAEAKTVARMVEAFEAQVEDLDESDETAAHMVLEIERFHQRIETIGDARRELTVYLAELEASIGRQQEDIEALLDELGAAHE